MAEKPVLNQKAIDAAKAKNAAAAQKAAAAQARVNELQPKAELAKKVVDRTTSGIATAKKISKKKGNTTGSQAFIDKYQPIATQNQTDILDPFNKATADLAAAEGMEVDIPEAIYASEGSTSAYDLITLELNKMGLSSLITPLKELFESGISDSDSLRLALSQRPEYEARFSANAKRIAAGLTALSPAAYLQLEDQYQEVMRQYGLPASYYTKDNTGKQPGFDELLSGDVSAAELEDRLITGQERVLKANPEVLKALKDFYPDIKNGDILAYTLDPKNAIKDIQRKVTTAEIGGAAMQAGLNLGNTPEARAIYAARAAELAAAGVTKQQAQQGFQTVAEVAPRGSQLAEIYKQDPYTQTTAEAEVFGLAGSTEAARQRKKLTSLETAAFGGSAGAGAIARDRAGVL